MLADKMHVIRFEKNINQPSIKLHSYCEDGFIIEFMIALMKLLSSLLQTLDWHDQYESRHKAAILPRWQAIRGPILTQFFKRLLAGTALAIPLLAGPVLAQTAGSQAAQPNQAPRADSISPRAGMREFQPLGSYPTNTVTNRPFVGPQEGSEGYKTTVAALQRTLTELQQLQLEQKQAHWNVSGTLWLTLHELLQEHYAATSKYADMVAERLLAIGSSSDGRAHTIVQGSSIPEIPGGYLDDSQVIAWFVNAYKVVGDELRQSIKDTNEPDPTTSNLLQEVEQNIDKYQWQMRAFVQATPTDHNTGWDLNDNKPIDLPSGTPAGQPPAGQTGAQPNQRK